MSRDFPALGFDPAPGELGAVDGLRSRLDSVSTALAEARTTMSGIAQAGGWEGQAAEAFRGSVGEFPRHLDTAATAMTAAAAALDGWHADLSSLQRTADQLEAEAAEAKRQIEQARSNPALPTLGNVGVFVTDITGGDAEAARQAQAALDAAEQRNDDIREQAERLKEQHEELAKEGARKLKQAGENAPEGPGLLSQALGLAGDLVGSSPFVRYTLENPNVVANVSDVIGDTAFVVGSAGILAPPLGPAGNVLSGVAFGGHYFARAAGADVSDQTLTGDFLGAIPTFGPPARLGQQTVDNLNLFQTIATGVPAAPGLLQNYQNYWLPQSPEQWGTYGATLGLAQPGIAFWNAVEQGHVEDQALFAERAKEQ